MRRWMAVVAALSISCLIAACGSAERAAPEEDTPPVRLATVEERTVPRTISISATLMPNRKATITSKVAGALEHVYAREGDTVRAGEPLARVEQTDYRLALEKAWADLEMAQAGSSQAQAQLVTARAQYERFRVLREQDAVPQADFDKVEAAYRAAEAAFKAACSQMRAAKTGLNLARQRLSNTVIRAPFDGVVVKRLADPGEVVHPPPMASPIMVIADIASLRAEGAVGEMDLPKVKVGMPARVTVDAFPGEVFEGVVERVNRMIDPATQTAKVWVRLPNPEGRLLPGMAGKIIIDVGSRAMPVIPRPALVDYEEEKARVFVYDAPAVRLREVAIEPGFEALVPVRDGLKAGERVVVWGHGRLRDGQTVTVVGRDTSATDTSTREHPR